MDNNKIKNLKKRHAKEIIFQLFGIFGIGLATLFLLLLFGMILSKSSSAFLQTKMALEIDLSKSAFEQNFDEETNQNLEPINYRRLIKQALRQKFSDAKSVSEIGASYQMLSKIAALELEEQIQKQPQLLGQKNIFWLSVSSKIDVFFKHGETANLSSLQKIWAENLVAKKELKTFFNWNFFKLADSREPEIAGIGASLIGSFLVMIIFLGLAFPIGVMCAFYLEEFAPKNRITDIIEISINNLAAIPSIIYGLLGLTVYLQFFYLPRSSALVGGLTLFMLVLPIIIIATRNTIRSIPSAISDAAMALGASKMQIIWHHLLPLSIPGIMTGAILAMSRALGETAPLLMIGMIAFIADIPQNFLDPTTVLPVQIYLWSDSPETGFIDKTAAAILILLGFLILLNLIAIILRKKFERHW
ncbi:MAG: phosphate ABC transporter permease PstA [Rickettsiales bacterium]|nr:phosphate ABC transporter permease PstA [Rickettsiales bacterium]